MASIRIVGYYLSANTLLECGQTDRDTDIQALNGSFRHNIN